MLNKGNKREWQQTESWAKKSEPKINFVYQMYQIKRTNNENFSKNQKNVV